MDRWHPAWWAASGVLKVNVRVVGRAVVGAVEAGGGGPVIVGGAADGDDQHEVVAADLD